MRAPWCAASWSFMIIMPWVFRGHKREPSLFFPCKTAGKRGKKGPAAVLLFRALMVYYKRLRSHFARAVPTPQEAVKTVDFAGAILSRHSVVTPAPACTTARPLAPSPSTKVRRASDWARLARARPRCWCLFSLKGNCFVRCSRARTMSLCQ